MSNRNYVVPYGGAGDTTSVEPPLPPLSSFHPALKYFRILAAEHVNMSDEEVVVWLEMTEPLVSRSFFGLTYLQALALLTAHRITMKKKAEAEAEGAYTIASLSEDGSKISYKHDTPSVSADDSTLALTRYGQAFMEIKNNRPVGPIF